MKKYLLISVSMFVCFQLIAEKLPYTIMAPSGVFLREGPSVDSKKLGSVLFGEVVYKIIPKDLNENQEGYYQHEAVSDYIRYYEKSLLDSIIIEGIRGHWIYVRYHQLKRYIFSGFALPGIWITKSDGDLNKDFQLLQSGLQISAFSFDPKLNWYAFEEKSNKLQGVEVSLKHWVADSMTSYAPEWGFPITILINGVEDYRWLIGLKNQLPDTATQVAFNTSLPHKNISFRQGAYLYPTELLTIYCNTDLNKNLFAEEKIVLDSSSEEGFTKTYQLLYKEGNPWEYLLPYNLSEDLEIEGAAADHSLFLTPVLNWVGDINGDGQPDFIVSSGQAFESHGGRTVYALYVFDDTVPSRIRLVSKIVIVGYDFC